MSVIVRWYNQNRKMIWIVVLTFIGVFALTQTLNNYYKNKKPEDKISSNSGSTITTNYNKDNYSVVTGENINQNVAKKSTDVINKFFEYCNSKDLENAYNLLSLDCKQDIYPTLNDFVTNYYNRIFTEKRSYNSTLWTTNSNVNTYRIQIMADLLSTGKKEYMPIEDYYTITDEDGEYKLNISNYVGKENINASKTQDNIVVTIVSKKIYMDYEIYEIKVENNTGTKMIFNTKEKTNSMYLEDNKEVKHIAFLNEIPDNQLEIGNGVTRTLEIKFNKEYNPGIKVKKIIFNDIKIGNNEKKISIEIEV